MMEDRIKKLENEVSETKTELKLQNRTLQIMSETLKEVKEQNKTLHNVDIRLLEVSNMLNTTQSQVKILFKYKDDVEDRVRELENSSTSQKVKLGEGERMFWLIATVAVGAIANYIGKM